MKKRFVSFSEFNTYYEYGDVDYFRGYILGFRSPQNIYMKFGTTVHEALNPDSGIDVEKAISEMILMERAKPKAAYERIMKEILANTPRCNEYEKALFIDLEEMSLFAGIDGVQDNHLVEYKTGGQFWTQQRADEHEQITHYILSWYLETEELMPFKLISINSNNGGVKEFETTRTVEQLDEWTNKLMQFKKDLVEKGWWERKSKFDDRVELLS